MALNFPNSPTDGQIYTDTPSGNRWVWDSANTVWKSTSTFTQTITVASSAPGSPVVGQLWWNQDYGRLLVYYNDGTSSQWVDASPSDYTSALAFGQANTVFGVANAAYNTANSFSGVYGVANAAFGKANNALANTTGTFVGDLSVTGLISGLNIINSPVSITGTASLTSSAFGKIHQCSGTTSNYAVTLPAVSGNTGKIIAFQMSTSLTKLVTITGSGAETIDGSNTRIMWAGETAILYCDGSSWTKIAGKTIPMLGHLTTNANQTISASTDTKRSLNATTGIDNGAPGMSDTTNSKIVIQRAGKYELSASWRIQNMPSAFNTEIRIYKNGVEDIINSRLNSSGDWCVTQVNNGKSLAVNDYLELYVKQYTAGSVTAYNDINTFLKVIELPQW